MVRWVQYVLTVLLLLCGPLLSRSWFGPRRLRVNQAQDYQGGSTEARAPLLLCTGWSIASFQWEVLDNKEERRHCGNLLDGSPWNSKYLVGNPSSRISICLLMVDPIPQTTRTTDSRRIRVLVARSIRVCITTAATSTSLPVSSVVAGMYTLQSRSKSRLNFVCHYSHGLRQLTTASIAHPAMSTAYPTGLRFSTTKCVHAARRHR